MHTHASQNRAYSLVWNEASQSFVPAPEGVRQRGKRGGTVTAAAAVSAFLSAGMVYAAPPPPSAATLPTGGTVSVGQAGISTTGTTTTIRQTSDRAAIDWQSFSIGSDAAVRFLQPSANAVALNRVVGQDPTQIFGQLSANGQVFIVNPNGVLFAPGAQVNAAGILASTRSISKADFAAGNYKFSGNNTATVDNQGMLKAADGGYVVLFGAQVTNSGSITANRGDVRLAAADEVTVKLDGSRLAGFTVTQGTLDGIVSNKGLIQADGAASSSPPTASTPSRGRWSTTKASSRPRASATSAGSSCCRATW